jgi:hypothetical protein
MYKNKYIQWAFYSHTLDNIWSISFVLVSEILALLYFFLTVHF